MNILVEETNCCPCDTQRLKISKHLFSECPLFIEVKKGIEQWTCLPIELVEVIEVMVKIKRKKWKQFQKQVVIAT